MAKCNVCILIIIFIDCYALLRNCSRFRVIPHKMAEVVQRKLEAMLPELEELQRVGLFTRGEVQSIIRKRRTFEYRMLRRPADKEDFLQAIQVVLVQGPSRLSTWSGGVL